jgi:SOS-response transcriptional repressor LexA
MTPEIRVNDVLVIEPTVSPNPGDYVVVKLTNKSEVIVCQYKKLSYTSSVFELVTLNDNWPNVKGDESIGIEVVGKVKQNIREYQ